MAETQDNVKVYSDDWYQVSAADVQSLQVLSGTAGIIYAGTKPDVSIRPGAKGFKRSAGRDDFLVNGTGGTSWARATMMSRSATIAVVEG